MKLYPNLRTQTFLCLILITFSFFFSNSRKNRFLNFCFKDYSNNFDIYTEKFVETLRINTNPTTNKPVNTSLLDYNLILIYFKLEHLFSVINDGRFQCNNDFNKYALQIEVVRRVRNSKLLK